MASTSSSLASPSATSSSSATSSTSATSATLTTPIPTDIEWLYEHVSLDDRLRFATEFDVEYKDALEISPIMDKKYSHIVVGVMFRLAIDSFSVTPIDALPAHAYASSSFPLCMGAQHHVILRQPSPDIPIDPRRRDPVCSALFDTIWRRSITFPCGISLEKQIKPELHDVIAYHPMILCPVWNRARDLIYFFLGTRSTRITVVCAINTKTVVGVRWENSRMVVTRSPEKIPPTWWGTSMFPVYMENGMILPANPEYQPVIKEIPKRDDHKDTSEFVAALIVAEAEIAQHLPRASAADPSVTSMLLEHQNKLEALRNNYLSDLLMIK